MIRRTVGWLVGHTIGNAAKVVDRGLDVLWPLEVHARSYLSMWDDVTHSRYVDDVLEGEEQLVAREAMREVWEPDELWAAQGRTTDGHLPCTVCGHLGREHKPNHISSPCAIPNCSCVDGIWRQCGFCDTDDFAEPLGEHPDIEPLISPAVRGSQQETPGGGEAHPPSPAAGHPTTLTDDEVSLLRAACRADDIHVVTTALLDHTPSRDHYGVTYRCLCGAPTTGAQEWRAHIAPVIADALWPQM